MNRESPVSVDLNFSNRRMRTRLSGGVGGEVTLPLSRFDCIGGLAQRSRAVKSFESAGQGMRYATGIPPSRVTKAARAVKPSGA